MKRRNKNRSANFSSRFSLEQLETRQMLSAELVPDTSPFGTAMVFNKARSTFQVTKPDQTSFLPTDSIYVYAGWKNTGDPVPANFQVDFAIYVDNVLTDSDFFSFTNGDPLGTNASFARINFEAGKLGVGTHEIKLVIDTNNAVAEGNENNNTETRQITVTGDPASKVSFVGGVKPTIAGSTIAPVKVKVTNNKNQPIYNETVELAIFSGPNGGVLQGTVQATTNNKGEAVFSNLELDTAGTYKFVATDGPLTSTATAPFKISPGAVTTLSFSQQPTAVIAGAKISPAIQVLATDAFGNPVPAKAIKLSINTGPNGAKVTGSIAGTTNASGVATFATTALKTAGDYKFDAAYKLGTNPAITVTSNQFTVSPAAAAKLIFTTLPTGATHGVNTTAVVKAVDAFGNVCTNQNTGAISLVLLAKPVGGLLAGTTTQNVASGVATFNDLQFNNAGKYSLKAQMGTKTFNSLTFVVA